MLSFVLITEAKIKINKRMDVGEKGTETWGLTENESMLQPRNEL